MNGYLQGTLPKLGNSLEFNNITSWERCLKVFQTVILNGEADLTFTDELHAL